MKTTVLIILALLIVLFCRAGNHYVSSSSGNDGNPGTIGSPWKTLTKVNAVFSTFAIGDSLLFKCGDTFLGHLTVSKSGTVASPIVISSYSTGAKPIISGLVTLDTWTIVSGNIWQCTPDSTLKKNVNILTINGIPQAIGRTPWLVYQSATSTQLTSSSLTGSPSYVGAEIVMKKNAFVSEKAFVTAQSGSTVTYSLTGEQPINNSGNAPTQAGRANYGFFMQRFAGTLDAQGEWFFNNVTNKMQLYSTTNPNSSTIKASYVDTIIIIGNKQNIILYNLAIEGGGLYGVETYGGAGIRVENCDFNNNTLPIYAWTLQDGVILNNNLQNNFYAGINVNGNSTTASKRILISGNIVHNTGQLIGNGVFNNEHALRGIIAKTDATTASNFISVIGNTVRNTGNGAIHWQGSNVTIRRNICDTFCNELQDNGGIYSFISTTVTNSTNYVNRIVDSNFISNAIGSPQGENGNVDVTGIYNDDQVLNTVIQHNTVHRIPGNGIQLNDPLNMEVYDNTVYNCNYLIDLNRYSFGAISGNRITRNILYQLNSTQRNFLAVNNDRTRAPSQTIAQFLTSLSFIDSNWISDQFFSGYQYYYRDNTSSPWTFPPNLTLAQWRNPYVHEVHSILPPVVLTATNSTLYTNPTSSPLTVFFSGLSKIDPKGNVFNHQITIPKWSSVILIDNGNATSVNKIPVANAGPDQAITLPVTQVNLSGSGSDSDGVITLYHWIQLAGGPNTANIVSPNSASTVVNGLIPGIYQFQLTVTDNNGATGSSIMKTTVSAAANQSPTVNAGSDIIITLPQNSTTLTAVGNDPDGSIASYHWVKISGTGGNIVSPNSASTVVNGLTQGVYQYEVTVTDNKGATAKDNVQVTVNAAPNNPPVVSAGTDFSVQLPANTANLSGSASDGDGFIARVYWTKTSGGVGGNISNPAILNPSISNLQQGIYQYQLLAVDDDSATNVSTVTITVLAAVVVNQPPTANAGADSTITLPQTTSTLIGYGIDVEDSAIFSHHWVKLAGSPAGGNITDPDSAITAITGLQQGIYQYELTVTDSSGAQGTDIVQITVNPAVVVNQNPTVIINGGQNIDVTLPQNSTRLTGVATDADGQVISWTWVIKSGPGGGDIATPDSTNTTVNNLQVGTYVYELSVVDNDGGTGKNVVTVYVHDAIISNIPPTVAAGNDTTVVAPVNSTNIVGTATDSDGSIAYTVWSKISGPSGGNITDPNLLSTGITSLQQGVYVFQLLAVDDDSAVGTSTRTITVAPPVVVNQNPVVTVGSNIIIQLPVNSTTLTGSATDADGTVDFYNWTYVSGPASYSITSPNTQNSGLTGLVQGVYKFQLQATDNSGGTGTNLIQVDVLPPVVLIPPVATINLGRDTIITLPQTSVTLTGTGTDADGTANSQVWTFVSGPAGSTISSPNSFTTSFTGLVQGTYLFQLTVTDNDGLIGTDIVQIDVLAPYVGARVDLKGYIIHAN